MKPLTPASPHAIIMVGIPGSGKSTFAEHFAKTFQAPIINTGDLRRELDLSDTQAEALQERFLKEVLKTHRTVLIEAVSQRRAQRMALVKLVTEAGFKPLIVWVQTDQAESKRRATKAYPRGSGMSAEAFDTQLRAFQPPTAQDGALVISGKHTYATQLKVVLKQLAATPRPPIKREEADPVPKPRPRARGITIQ